MDKPNPAPWFSVFFRRGHLLALSILVVLVAGWSAVTTLPRLEDPRIDTRNVLVLTPYPGASAERVEALVSDVLEDELRQLHEIKEIKSTSRAGISVLSIELQAWVDSSTNEQIFSKIRDSLADAEQQFPQGAGEPELDEKRGATAFTMLLALRPADGQQTPLSIITRMSEELADRLRNMPGTELVRVYGELDEEISVNIDPQQLATTGLTLSQVSQVIASADPKLPAGVLRARHQDLRIQVSQELDSLNVVRNLPLNSNANGNFLRLQDIAEVKREWRDPPTDVALVNGEQVVFVAARMQTSVRVDTWTQNAKQVVEKFDRDFNGTVYADIVFEQNLYTEARLGDLTSNLLLGCIVVMAVIMLFMGLRASWIVGLALPLCAAFAVFSLSFFGEQIHQMSIFGIIIAIGLLIDNAIVITDEIRANLQKTEYSRLNALTVSIRHLFTPLLASTLTTILGFMPIFLLPGNIGDFVGPIAISVVMALIGSFVISLTLIAALAARYLSREADHAKRPWYTGGLQMPATSAWFRARLTDAIKKPFFALAFTVTLPLLGFVLASQLGNVFFPSADRNQFEIYMWMPNGTSLQATEALVADMDEHIRSQPEVEQVTWLIGGSAPSVYYNQVMNRDNTPQFANAVVTTRGIASAAKMISSLQFELDAKFTQAKVVVRAFGQGPPISAPLGVEIYGADLNVLNDLGDKVRLAMAQLPGVTQSIASIDMGEPELVFNTDRDSVRLSNLSLAGIANQLQVSLDGTLGGSILEGTEEIPIRVRLGDRRRGDLAEVSSLPLLPGPNQDWLPLSALGEFELMPTITGITRKNGVRVNIVEAFLLPNATAVDAANALQRYLQSDEFVLPEGYRLKMAGDADEQQEAVGQLATYAPVLMVLMITTLILSFSSIRLALVIGSVAVLSVGLGMFSLWLSGMPLGFNPILGSAGLIGVAINGSIVVIAAINANEQARLGNVAEIVQETMSCSRHILSTTFTTVGGFIPLLLFSEGSFWPPLAVVLAGGVGFSIMLSLVFTPLVVGRMAIRRGKRMQTQMQSSIATNASPAS